MLLKHSRKCQDNKMSGYIIFISQRRSGIPKVGGSRIFRFQSAVALICWGHTL